MRYSSHPPRAFRNRIARNLVVLVAAALIATLGLPSAAQAQTPTAPTVTGAGDGTDGDAGLITAMWGIPLDNTRHNGWLLEYTAPGVAWDDATPLPLLDQDTRMSKFPANDLDNHNGVWRFRVSYYNTQDAVVIGDASALTDYLHGPPAAPTGFTAHNAGPDARRLDWDDVTGAKSYEHRYTADDEWTGWEPAESGLLVEDLEPGTEYTFEVRALGYSRAGVGDLHGPSASITEMMPMPMPTPTLPEIALLLLAMLLLGSGVYLLRGRQSGGLTHA